MAPWWTKLRWTQRANAAMLAGLRHLYSKRGGRSQLEKTIRSFVGTVHNGKLSGPLRPGSGQEFFPPNFRYAEECRMAPEIPQSESPYSVKIETATGGSTTIPTAVLTPKQLENFLQIEFKRLAEEAGVKGARIHVERAVAADYEQVMREVAACLRSAKASAA